MEGSCAKSVVEYAHFDFGGAESYVQVAHFASSCSTSVVTYTHFDFRGAVSHVKVAHFESCCAKSVVKYANFDCGDAACPMYGLLNLKAHALKSELSKVSISIFVKFELQSMSLKIESI